MPTSTLTSKGQITVPKEVREHLHLAPGDEVEFAIDEQGAVTFRALRGAAAELFGCLRRTGARPVTVAEMDEVIGRRAADDDERIRRGARARR